MWQNFLRNTNLQQTADSQLFVTKTRRNNAQKTYNHEVLNSAWLRINGSQATKSHADIFSYRSHRLLHALRNVGSSDDAYRHRELHCVQHSLHHLPEPFGVALWGDGRYLANCMYIDHGGRWHQSSVAIIMRDGEITNKSECLPLLWKITEKS